MRMKDLSLWFTLLLVSVAFSSSTLDIGRCCSLILDPLPSTPIHEVGYKGTPSQDQDFDLHLHLQWERARARESQVVHCINDSLTIDRFLLATLPYARVPTQEGPSLGVGIVTRATPSVYSYALYSLVMMHDYANMNGYLLLPLLPDSEALDYAFHRKVVPLLEWMGVVPSVLDAYVSERVRNSDRKLGVLGLGLNSIPDPLSIRIPGQGVGVGKGLGLGLGLDYLVWWDADLVPLDTSFRLEQLAARYPKAHIIMSADVSSIANSGWIVVKNTNFSRRFLGFWWLIGLDHIRMLRSRANSQNIQEDDGFTDQIGFEIAYNSLTSIEQSKIHIVPSGELDSVAPATGHQTKKHVLLHLAGESGDYRRSVFRTGAMNVCRTRHANSTNGQVGVGVGVQPIPQWGLHRVALQSLAVESYVTAATHELTTLECAVGFDSFYSTNTNINNNAVTDVDTENSGGSGNECANSALSLWTATRMGQLRRVISKASYSLETMEDSGYVSVTQPQVRNRDSASASALESGKSTSTAVIRGRAWRSSIELAAQIALLENPIIGHQLSSCMSLLPPTSSTTGTEKVRSRFNLPLDSDVPELLKLSLELGHEWWHVLREKEARDDTVVLSSSTSSSHDGSKHQQQVTESNKLEWGQYLTYLRDNFITGPTSSADMALCLSCLLDVLERIVSPSQIVIVLGMRAGLENDIGSDLMLIGHVAEALDHFRSAVECYSQINAAGAGTDGTGAGAGEGTGYGYDRVSEAVLHLHMGEALCALASQGDQGSSSTTTSNSGKQSAMYESALGAFRTAIARGDVWVGAESVAGAAREAISRCQHKYEQFVRLKSDSAGAKAKGNTAEL
jgi:hypothetical protein